MNQPTGYNTNQAKQAQAMTTAAQNSNAMAQSQFTASAVTASNNVFGNSTENMHSDIAATQADRTGEATADNLITNIEKMYEDIRSRDKKIVECINKKR